MSPSGWDLSSGTPSVYTKSHSITPRLYTFAKYNEASGELLFSTSIFSYSEFCYTFTTHYTMLYECVWTTNCTLVWLSSRKAFCTPSLVDFARHPEVNSGENKKIKNEKARKTFTCPLECRRRETFFRTLNWTLLFLILRWFFLFMGRGIAEWPLDWIYRQQCIKRNWIMFWQCFLLSTAMKNSPRNTDTVLLASLNESSTTDSQLVCVFWW